MIFGLSILCLILLGALVWALTRLYDLERRDSTPAAPETPGLEFSRFDRLLSSLMELHEMGLASTGASSKEDFSQCVLESACALMGSKRGSIMVFNKERENLSIIASKGLSEEVIASGDLKPGEGIAGMVFERGEALYISDPKADPRYAQYVDAPESQEPFCSVPLKLKDKTVGVLNLHATDESADFGEYNRKFLQILGGEAAIAIENLDLYDSLQSFYLEMVQTLARAVDAKDNYTHDHADRARFKAQRIAKELKLPDQMVRFVEYGALLHDIGKVGIDDSILLKPGKLTPEEYEVMKAHPKIGHDILSPVKQLGPVAQIVLYHQEWFNGQGYPEGLKGEEIPVGSRIVAIIDAWDAMTSDRPYRKALPRQKAVDELRKFAGTQFDPKIVEIFLEIEIQEWQAETAQGANNAPPPDKQ